MSERGKKNVWGKSTSREDGWRQSISLFPLLIKVHNYSRYDSSIMISLRHRILRVTVLSIRLGGPSSELEIARAQGTDKQPVQW